MKLKTKIGIISLVSIVLLAMGISIYLLVGKRDISISRVVKKASPLILKEAKEKLSEKLKPKRSSQKKFDIILSNDLKIIKLINLTKDMKENSILPAWSPNGESIVYYSNNNIWIVDAINFQNKKLPCKNLTKGSRCFSLLWSPNSEIIGYQEKIWKRESNEYINNIGVVDKEGGNKILVSTTSLESALLSWSLENDKLLYSFNEEIWSVTMNNSSKSFLCSLKDDKLILPNQIQISKKTISPDGKKAAFILGAKEAYRTYDNGIWIMNIDGTNKKQIVRENIGIWESEPVLIWSSDGSKIAYIAIENGKTQIWIVNSNGTNKKVIFEADTLNTDSEWTFVPQLSFSPDGSKIAGYFYKDKDKNNEWDLSDTFDIWVIDINRESMINLIPRVKCLEPYDTESISYFSPLNWSPDGKKIAFVSNKEGKIDIWVAILGFQE